MKSYVTPEDILDEIAKSGSAKVSWLFLRNSFFRGQGDLAQQRLEQWADANGLEWFSEPVKQSNDETITIRRRRAS